MTGEIVKVWRDDWASELRENVGLLRARDEAYLADLAFRGTTSPKYAAWLQDALQFEIDCVLASELSDDHLVAAILREVAPDDGLGEVSPYCPSAIIPITRKPDVAEPSAVSLDAPTAAQMPRSVPAAQADPDVVDSDERSASTFGGVPGEYETVEARLSGPPLAEKATTWLPRFWRRSSEQNRVEERPEASPHPQSREGDAWHLIRQMTLRDLQGCRLIADGMPFEQAASECGISTESEKANLSLYASIFRDLTSAEGTRAALADALADVSSDLVRLLRNLAASRLSPLPSRQPPERISTPGMAAHSKQT